MIIRELLFLVFAAGVSSALVNGVARVIGGNGADAVSKKRVPALGGVATMAVLAGVFWGFGILPPEIQTALVVAMIGIAVIGLVDIRRRLGPWTQLGTQTLIAAAFVVQSGVAVRYVTNPLGGLWRFDQWMVDGVPVAGVLLTVLWMVTLMNVMNFLDGVDGLAGGVGAVAFLTIGFVSMLPQVHEPATAAAAFITATALAGFLFWNFPPAALYLGTAGAWFIGFFLAALSTQGSSKIATTAVVGAIPLLDAGVVILNRLRRRSSPLRGDTTHLHHVLRDRGFSPKQILAAYVVAAGALALAAVLLPTSLKFLLLLVVGTGFFTLVFHR